MMATGSVVDRVTLDDVVRLGFFEPLRRKGASLCPLHAERTPSFHVSRDRRLFHCFGCGRSGGVLDLVVALGVAPTRVVAARWLEDILS